MRRILPLVCLAAPVFAQSTAFEAEEAFVEANLLSIFYHEMGHALIDVMGLPVFGQEEDAADVASVILIDWIFDNETALDLAYGASLGFAAEATLDQGQEIAWWGVHGANAQRFYNTVCLFYGGDPDTRDDFAADMDLPKERAETCEEEFELAADSWVPVLEELAETDGTDMTLDLDGPSFTADVIGAEVAALNDAFDMPEPLQVRVEDCGEPNAFYDPDEVAIIMCTEFEDHLRALFAINPE